MYEVKSRNESTIKYNNNNNNINNIIVAAEKRVRLIADSFIAALFR
jgi:hypothetical protein